jgi:hypothetical protein
VLFDAVCPSFGKYKLLQFHGKLTFLKIRNLTCCGSSSVHNCDTRVR